MKRIVVRNVALAVCMLTGLNSCAWLSKVFRPYPAHTWENPHGTQPSGHGTTGAGIVDPPNKPDGDKPVDPGNPAVDKPKYPVAVAVEGRPGFVLNPYTGNLVDVRDIQSMTLVRDPADPDETHLFRVP
ncbi:hypothetical protein SAMN02745181_2449 [Rubritalea squalenifaciens DSM 18772]|uniref:Uncharacterized protein n=1 Tax=Rubritalea squalenifaciens DSM 18772 TaxID=1123071 RepID=A0A1M6LN23_9BACT|nr:hypothetical protein [Rubritalea squalenifaciens]SHJ72638.1 hypothetical protein SAMN02745181_2449 [Rubritalea squalenifaciens DSM 18772]